jgi:TetR/AcrR family transcriptional repressor of nem operon
MAQQTMNRERLERCLDQYLTLAHVHNREGGCAIPALGAEIAQAPLPVREEAEHWLSALQHAWADTLQDPALAWALLSQCVGALVIARMLACESSQQEVLKASREFLAGALHDHP